MVEGLGLFTVAFSALNWYWMVGLFVFAIWFVAAAFDEQLIGTALVAALFLGIAHASGFMNLKAIDIVLTIYIALIYLAVGCIWSLFKYKIEVKKIADNYIDDNRRYKYNATQLKENILLRIESKISKSLIASWVVLFPFGVLKFIFGDFVEYIVSKLGRIYRKIAEYVIEKVISNSIKVPTQDKE